MFIERGCKPSEINIFENVNYLIWVRINYFFHHDLFSSEIKYKQTQILKISQLNNEILFRCTFSENQYIHFFWKIVTFLEELDQTKLNLIPSKSRNVYWNWYSKYAEYKVNIGAREDSLELIIRFFSEMKGTYKISTLWQCA